MQKVTLEEFKGRSNLAHNYFFDYSNSHFEHTHKKTIIGCPIHGEFSQMVKSHMKGLNGCALCTGKASYTNEQFIFKAKEKYGDLYSYEKTNYINNKSKITITCKLHGDYNIAPGFFLHKTSGCKLCTKSSFINYDYLIKMAAMHQSKHDYSLVSKNINSNSTIRIICNLHGEFEQNVWIHLKKMSCPKCSGKYKATTDFINEANEVHNHKYDYSLSKYTKAINKVIIKCVIHGEFNQSPNAHLTGKGCVKCGVSVSRKEIKWINSFNNSNIKTQHPIKINNKKYNVDGFDNTTNTIYEFYGDFWHGNPNKYKSYDINHMNGKSFGYLYSKTISRENELKLAGFNIVNIWELNFKG